MKKRTEGFTLAELLVGMVIASMASAVLIRSLTFSLQFYQANSNDTSAQLLCDTVFLLLQDELMNNPYSADVASYQVDPLDETVYGKAPEIDDVTLPKSCYGFGDSDEMSRKVNIIIEPKETYYTVTVSVKNQSGTTVAVKQRDVHPL